MSAIGSHYILEMYDCPRDRLNDLNFVREVLRKAAGEARATLMQEAAHHFQPHGVTAVGILAESHISIHTWPEYGYAAADIFTCGDTAKPDFGCRFIAQQFGSPRYEIRTIERGPELMACPAFSGASASKPPFAAGP